MQSDRRAFVGGTLIDATGAPPRVDTAVLTEQNRFSWIGPAAERDQSDELQVVDVSGKWLIPGLLDGNVHFVEHVDPDVLLRYPPGEYDELVVEAAQIALQAGVTTVFDTWGPLQALRRVRDRINAGSVIGSRMFIAGNIIGNGGPWSADFSNYETSQNTIVAERINHEWTQGVGSELTWMSAEGVRDAVREYIATSGVDFIKYASSAHAHFRFIALSPDAQQAIVEEAHTGGMTAQACALTPEALKLAIQAGVDLLQHADVTGNHPMPEETLRLIVERQLPAVVMLHTNRHLDAVKDDTTMPRHWLQSFFTMDSNARRLIEAGAKLMLAQDAGVFGADVHGSPFLGSLLAYPDSRYVLGQGHLVWLKGAAERGMDPMAALLAATRNIAEGYHKLDELGTVEVGKRADLLVLDANPLSDPANYARIAHVVKDGAVIDRDRLPERPILSAR